MELQCRQTCMRCNRDELAAEGNMDKLSDAACTNDHDNCPNWIQNGFCQSTHYSSQIKREICPKACNFC